MPAGRVPVSLYRLQLTPHFGFAAVIKIADYLVDLGVTHVYLSPILQAVPDSEHGYDVTDHSRIRAEFGGEAGFREMAAALRGRGIGIVLDIVPNHMAVPTPEFQNRPLWSVLHCGRESEYAHWFDIDWTVHEGRMLLPILPARPQECLDDMWVDRDGPDGLPVLRYFDHMLPLWPGTARLPMIGLLESQHWKLSDWHEVSTSLNWRRFFDIASLIGIRVEDPGVFDATHEVILRLVDEGLIDGLRVDHPDGLADPRGYFRRLAEATGGMWVVAEKILAVGEWLPADWPVAGTTGYDALRLACGLFLDPDGAQPLSAAYAGFVEKSGSPAPPATFAEVASVAKREVTAASFGSEVNRLCRVLAKAGVQAAPGDLREVLNEFLAAFDVYRAYTYPGERPTSTAGEAIRRAMDDARSRLPVRLHPVLAVVATAALSGDGEFAVRLQQTTGPILAKGVEDTADYRWPRLVSLDEVGGNPDRFGVLPQEFHAEAARFQAAWPATLTTLSTHDTKRQEDGRARLAVLAEIPREWSEKVTDWHRQAYPSHGPGCDEVVDAETEYFLWQTFVSAWPLSGYRLSGYLTKAVREAKQHTSWTSPNAYYEAAVHGFAAQILSDGDLVTGIRAFVDEISPDAMVASLGAKLVQLTMPGVADVYQGCETGGLSLVDPDNRRSVDYARRWRMLAGLDSGELDLTARDSRKLLVTSRGLRMRRAHPDWFTGDAATYSPLAAEGPAAGHVVAFARSSREVTAAAACVTVATRLPVGLRRRGGWQDTVLPLPRGGGWRDAMTGATYDDDRVPLAELTRTLPVALLERT